MSARRGLPITPRSAQADAAAPGAGSENEPDDAGPSSGRRRGRAPKRKRRNADAEGGAGFETRLPDRLLVQWTQDNALIASFLQPGLDALHYLVRPVHLHLLMAPATQACFPCGVHT